MSAITIIGAGNMARGIGTRAVAGGNTVQILARDADEAVALASDLGDAATGGTLDESVRGELVVLALWYDAERSVVGDHGEKFAGKTVVEISNPIDTSTFDGLVVPADSSAAQEIARLLPASTDVVKAFNTTFAATLVAGEVAGQPLDVLIAGDSQEAKSAVAELAASGGLRPLDVGPLDRARWLEGLGFLHMGLQVTRGTQYDTAIKLLG
ncbi:MAG TPA: NAD(P)-binding domain-containing protein [Actinopolymorphaceae bacterium]